MFGLIIFLHVLVCVVLVIVVLFQQPQKGGVTSVFGGGESVFGGGGAAPFITKLTSGLAILFMITSLSLVLLAARRTQPPAVRTSPQQTTPAPENPMPGEQEIPQQLPGGN
jgi:preprotein translocase subunit SecG